MKICSIEGCDKKYYAKELCLKHYSLQLRNGKPEYKSRESICIVENCNEMATPRTDYCSFHYIRKRNGTPLDIPKGRGNCGERNGRWNGGTSEYPNHSLMKKIRKEVLKESNYICQFCGGIAKEVHHRDLSKTNHSKENLIACCHKCNHQYKNPYKPYNSKYKRLFKEIVTGRLVATPAEKKALAKVLKKSVEQFVSSLKYCINCIYFTDEFGKHIKGCYLYPYKITLPNDTPCERLLEYDKR